MATAWLVLMQSVRGELSFQIIHSFPSAPPLRNPSAALTQGADGSLYGTTSAGNIFRISFDGQVTNLHTFTSGYGPYTLNKLLQSDDGSLYGTAWIPNLFFANSGPPPGILIRMTLDGNVGILTGFWGTNNGTGSQPLGTLIQLRDGTLMGTTFSGGTPIYGSWFGLGTVFQYRTDIFAGLLSYSFRGTNGFGPRGGLIQASDGNLYGTTSDTGNAYPPVSTKGTIFRVSNEGPTTLFTFYGTNGATPTGSLLEGQDGNLYGTTSAGGLGYGTVFKITTNGAFSSLFSFSGTDGSNPTGELLQLTDGDLYGTTSKGGINNSGTIFRIKTNGALTTIFRFDTYSTGGSPPGGLCLARDGNFYGTTSTGGLGSPGSLGGGTIFRLVSSPVITSTMQSNASVTLNWTSFTNAVYGVEYRTNIIVGPWLMLATNVTGAGGITSYTDSSADDAQRFYRVVLLPH